MDGYRATSLQVVSTNSCLVGTALGSCQTTCAIALAIDIEGYASRHMEALRGSERCAVAENQVHGASDFYATAYGDVAVHHIPALGHLGRFLRDCRGTRCDTILKLICRGIVHPVGNTTLRPRRGGSHK